MAKSQVDVARGLYEEGNFKKLVKKYWKPAVAALAVAGAAAGIYFGTQGNENKKLEGEELNKALKVPGQTELEKNPNKYRDEAVKDLNKSVKLGQTASYGEGNQTPDPNEGWIDPQNYKGDNEMYKFYIRIGTESRDAYVERGGTWKPLQKFRIAERLEATPEVLYFFGMKYGFTADEKSLKKKFPGYISAEVINFEHEKRGGHSIMIIHTKNGDIFLDYPF